MFCKECGKEVFGKYCSECGVPVKPITPIQKEGSISENTADILLTIIIPFIGIFIGIDYLFKNKWERGIGIIFLSLLAILVYVAIFSIIGVI